MTYSVEDKVDLTRSPPRIAGMIAVSVSRRFRDQSTSRLVHVTDVLLQGLPKVPVI